MALASCNYLAHVSGSTALMAIIGNASYVNCGALRTFLQGLAQHEGKTDLAIDFRRCTGLDSTVLGLVAKIAMELTAKTPSGRVVLANLDGRNLDLVKNLGCTMCAKSRKPRFPPRPKEPPRCNPARRARCATPTACSKPTRPS